MLSAVSCFIVPAVLGKRPGIHALVICVFALGPLLLTQYFVRGGIIMCTAVASCMAAKDGETMRYVTVLNQTTGQTLAARAAVADGFWSRFVGLQFARSLPSGAGIVLLPCESIHMFFMRFAIDAIFAAEDGRVVRVGRRLKPWTVGPFVRQALYCVEIPAGAADGTEEGHHIQLVREA